MKRVEGTICAEGPKRCYVDIVIKLPCPECGSELGHDFNGSYLSHPEVGDECNANFYCEKCDEDGKPCEYNLVVKITKYAIELEYDETSLKHDGF